MRYNFPESRSQTDGELLRPGDHRLRPALELLSRIPRESPALVVELACGAGNVTAYLRRRWTEASIIGIGSSSEMLVKAATTADFRPYSFRPN